MAEKYSRSVLRVVIAQLSQAVGFDSIQSSSLDILTNVLEQYLLVLSKSVHDFSEQCCQTKPNLLDVEFALKRMHVAIPDLVEYMQQMEPVAFPHKVPMFPAPKDSNLQFPSGNNPEDFDRAEHIPLYMPSMIVAPPKPIVETEENDLPESQKSKKATFVIAGKAQGSSSDEDDYSAGEASNEEYMSDDSLSHNPVKSRHLTKPEDIPTIEGTAPSSMMSEWDELRGSMSPTRRSSFETASELHERPVVKGKKSFDEPHNYTPSHKTTKPFQDLPWLSPDKPTPEKRHVPSTSSSVRKDSWASKTTKSEDPKWLSGKKKTADVYDADWLQGETASPVHLSKQHTPDLSLGSSTVEKKPWLSKDKDYSSTPSNKGTPSSKKLMTPQSGKQRLTSTPSSSSSHKHFSKQGIDRKSSHHKPYKSFKHSSSSKKADLGDEPIKAKIEAAERLIQGPPVPAYKPQTPKSVKREPGLQSPPKSPVRSSIERAEKLLKHPVENLNFPPSRETSPVIKQEKLFPGKSLEDKDRSNFASYKSMDDAIDAVINRASEETVKKDEQAKKDAEEADLMRFSHLVEDSSSSDSDADVSHKVEQMLQLEERGLRDAHPPTPGSSPIPTPSSAETPQSLDIDDEDEDVIVDSDSGESIPLPPKISPVSEKSKSKHEKHSKKEKHKKKMKRTDDGSSKSSHKSHSKSKKDKHIHKPASFVTTETISEKSVKMKVKLKHLKHPEPKLFDVDQDLFKADMKQTPKPFKEEKHKFKEGKHHKTKEHKKHSTPKLSEVKQSSGEHDMSVEKIILKKSKSGDAKVVKPKVKEHARSPSPPSPVISRNLPLPKLSAAVPVMNVTATIKEKEKKKSKKEKKKKKDRDKDKDIDIGWSHDKEIRRESKERSHHREKFKDPEKDVAISLRRDSFDSDAPSPMVPKLTLKMGASEKKFVIKQGGNSSVKSSTKKRSHSSIGDSPIPAKERKVSVESVKTVSESFAAAVERKVITQTISAGPAPAPLGVYEDEDGNKVWICPGCNKPDDGSPMIGCDTCDDWYHWPCVNIKKEPPDDVDWYCPRCIKRQQLSKLKGSAKKRKKK
ncbi:uncharacterized protein LOC120346397 [Styela clava]